MGREIRRVPLNWMHPKNEHGNYQPMYDQSFNEAFDEWFTGRQEWIADKDGVRTEAQNDYNNGQYMHYEELEGTSPDPCYYRPEWPEDATMGYCVYETVTEGTPQSPVFETLADLETWLIGEGYSEANAKAFCEMGWVPSAMLSPQTGVTMGIHSASIIQGTGEE